jgi:hypothetical protein
MIMSSTMTSTQVQHVPIDNNSNTELDRFISIIVSAFHETAITTAFIVDIDSTPPPYPSPSINSSRRRKHFEQGILDSAASGAELVHAGDWSAVALWEPASFRGVAFVDSKTKPGALLSEWRRKLAEVKKKHLSSSDNHDQLRPYYHLSFLARNPQAPKVPGSIAAVIEPFLERAREENVPVWLEATTKQAAKVYSHHGFRLVEEIVVGKGKVDSLGWPTSDGRGEGVTMYPMICDAHLRR